MAASALERSRSQNWSWQQTMLRVKDPKKSVPFYVEHFNMTLIDVYDFPEMKFSLYFLATLPKGERYNLTPGTIAAHEYLWSMKGTAIELTYNYGTESDDTKYHPGNAERDGFGHIAFNVDDVYAACTTLEAKGVEFKKKPNEGRMKGLAFAYDPDGYWIEIVKRADTGCEWDGYNLSQTMLRVKDPQASLKFYRDALGMNVLSQKDLGVGESWGFSLFFLGVGEEGKRPGLRFNPVLELTHNHGTEKDDEFTHFNGNSPPEKKGFGHLGFLVDDVDVACAALEELGYKFVKKPNDGSLKGLAFVQDPDGYWVEIIKRGGSAGIVDRAVTMSKMYGIDT